ncbi:lysozyme inhibitor LprI family protein [Azospirillum largimobile]
MPVLSLVSGLLAAGSMLAVLAAAPALAETPAPDAAAATCDVAETPSAQLLCRDAGLVAAGEAMEVALAALGATTDATGRAAIEAGQTVWRARRNDACPVTAADLADAKAAKSRTDCLLRVTRQRTAALEAERQARSRPVADLPLAVTGAAAPRFVAPQATVPPINRKATLAALSGRWAKADPNDRTAIDDCRTSYLEIGADRTLTAVDARVPQFPLTGRLPAEGDPVQEVSVQPLQPAEGAAEAAPAPLATLRLLPADSARFDRLILRMGAPATFAAEFVRCR